MENNNVVLTVQDTNRSTLKCTVCNREQVLITFMTTTQLLNTKENFYKKHAKCKRKENFEL